MKKIQGENIFLRPVLEEDYTLFADFMNDFEGTVCTDTISDNYTEKEEREYFVPNSEKRQFAVVDEADGSLLGLVELFNINWIHGVGELGIFIGEPSERDRGVGYEAMMLALDYAFDILNLRTVYLTVCEFNQRGIALYKKCGFQQAGRLRNQRTYGGKSYDLIYMDILKEEHSPYLLHRDLKKITE